MLASVSFDPETEFAQVFTAEPDLLGPAERLTDTPRDKKSPAWSPDDTRVAFISDIQIFIHKIASGTEEELVPVDVPVGQVPIELHAWVAAEDEHLLVTYKKPGQVYEPRQSYNHRYFLYAVNVQSGELTPIVPDSTLRGADWYLPQ